MYYTCQGSPVKRTMCMCVCVYMYRKRLIYINMYIKSFFFPKELALWDPAKSETRGEGLGAGKVIVEWGLPKDTFTATPQNL